MKKTMECFECDNPKAFRSRKVVHKYKEIGLDYVTLTGVEEFKCPKCGAIYFEIPKIKELHKLIALTILKKEKELIGAEIRYLRKQLGYSSEQFGKLLRYDPKTLSRIENGHQPVSGPLDRLVRMTYATGTRDLDYDLHDSLLGHGIEFERIELAYHLNESWELKKGVA